jgi:hypothetical protein
MWVRWVWYGAAVIIAAGTFDVFLDNKCGNSFAENREVVSIFFRADLGFFRIWEGVWYMSFQGPLLGEV